MRDRRLGRLATSTPAVAENEYPMDTERFSDCCLPIKSMRGNQELYRRHSLWLPGSEMRPLLSFWDQYAQKVVEQYPGQGMPLPKLSLGDNYSQAQSLCYDRSSHKAFFLKVKFRQFPENLIMRSGRSLLDSLPCAWAQIIVNQYLKLRLVQNGQIVRRGSWRTCAIQS